MQKCYKCGSKQIVKNGKVFGWQRYKCKDCGYQFTKNAPAGKPMHIKLLTHTLYSAGFTMRQISGIIGITAQSISRWIKRWHSTFVEETGYSQKFMRVKSQELLEIMNISQDAQYIVMRDELSSGAEIYITIKLPSQK
ncbi:MAG: IS1 family transposase [Alphaproteobacteria bacterium]|nr:IS1 family transposase [Alphaproteobacteria bacterium]MBR3502300.1 IS1 family transposase [Alphaproteobacteria bacterium]